MSTFLKLLKGFIESENSPDFIYQLYFNRLTKKRGQYLQGKLQKDQKLVDQLDEEKKAYWQKRIETVVRSPDNAFIPRVKGAGQLVNNKLLMHNGILVDPMSYYSLPLLQMLMDNRGVHEPQEERVFQDVIASMPTHKEKTMLELGAYWSFYSMWFLQKFQNARCFMVEPERENLFYGKRNFRLNGLKGTFINASIGKEKDANTRVLTVDEICRKYPIKFLDILHADIQGHELEMLQGSSRILSKKKVGYIFISTHSNELHQACRELLSVKYGYALVASANVDESYSWDGILLMKSPQYPGVEKLDISKRQNVN